MSNANQALQKIAREARIILVKLIISILFEFLARMIMIRYLGKFTNECTFLLLKRFLMSSISIRNYGGDL